MTATPLVGIHLAFLRGNEVTLFGLLMILAPVAVDREAAAPCRPMLGFRPAP